MLEAMFKGKMASRLPSGADLTGHMLAMASRKMVLPFVNCCPVAMP